MAGTKKNTTDLEAQIETDIVDNTTQEVSAEDERDAMLNIVASSLNLKTPGFLVEQEGGYQTEISLTDRKSFSHVGYINDLIAGIDVSGFFADGGNDFGGDAILGLTSNNALSFYTNNTQRLQITASGLVTISQKLLVGDTDASYLTGNDFVIIGSGNTSGSNAILIYNSDYAPIFKTRNDGGFQFYEKLYDGNGNKFFDPANRLLYANDGTSDRIDIQNGALYFGGGIKLDWKNLLLNGTWTIVDGDMVLSNQANAYYIGGATTNGSWRRRIDGTDLIDERREAGVWVEKNRITP